MKKVVLFCAGLFCCAHLEAQSVAPLGNKPVKLSDVIATYKKAHPDYGKRENGILKSILPELPRENNEEDYQFDRWVWYWKQHLDMSGYIVSPVKTWEEYNKAQKSEESNRTARTTSTGVSSLWKFQGPDSSNAFGEGVGRINVVAFHPTDSNTFWVGTPGGGAWKTTNSGASWVSMTDNQPSLSVSDIVFNPKHPSTVYLCTGDRDAQDFYGIGVLKSYDGGATWNTTGMSWTTTEYHIAHSLLINPRDTNSLILATTDGIYTSHNGGASFTLAHAGNYYQVLYRPNDTNTVYATSYIDYSLYPTITNAQVWRSTDAGVTWSVQTSLTTSARITIAVTPAAPNTVLAVSSAYDATGVNMSGLDGIYKSTDAGNTFTEIYTGGCTGNLLTWSTDGAECRGQGWYTLPLAISPVDSNVVFTGGVNSWRSDDGGYSWSIANQQSFEATGVVTVHADKHWMAFNPIAPKRFFETNDGGIYASYNPTSTGIWKNLTNRMGIEEIYRTSVSDIADFAITGAQDVGTKIVKPGGRYEEANGGDGMACLLDFADSTVAYGASEYGYIYLLNPTASSPIITSTEISSNILGGSIDGHGAWITPYIIEPSCHSCIVAAYGSVYRSTDFGRTWTTISGPLSSAGNVISRVVATVADAHTYYAVEDAYSQNIYYTFDDGATWTTLTSLYPGSQMISDIKIDPRDKTHIWVTYAGYGSAQVAQYSPARGWQHINTGLPDIPVMCFAIDSQSRDMYIGTEIGVYYRDSAMTAWMPYSTGMPVTRVADLEIKYNTNELWAATYGRSLWKSPKHSVTRTHGVGVSIVPFVADAFTIMPNPNHGDFTVAVKNITGKEVNLSLLDHNGKTVWQADGTVQDGMVPVNTHGLAAGNYILEITAAHVIQGRQKVVIY